MSRFLTFYRIFSRFHEIHLIFSRHIAFSRAHTPTRTPVLAGRPQLHNGRVDVPVAGEAGDLGNLDLWQPNRK